MPARRVSGVLGTGLDRLRYELGTASARARVATNASIFVGVSRALKPRRITLQPMASPSRSKTRSETAIFFQDFMTRFLSIALRVLRLLRAGVGIMDVEDLPSRIRALPNLRFVSRGIDGAALESSTHTVLPRDESQVGIGGNAKIGEGQLEPVALQNLGLQVI